MADSFFNDKSIELECPNCGEQINETIGRLKGDDYACPGCGVAIDTTEFRRGFDDAEKSLADFKRELKGLKFKL